MAPARILSLYLTVSEKYFTRDVTQFGSSGDNVRICESGSYRSKHTVSRFSSVMSTSRPSRSARAVKKVNLHFLNAHEGREQNLSPLFYVYFPMVPRRWKHLHSGECQLVIASRICFRKG